MAMQSVDGTRLYVERAGRAGPPLVLVHGSWVDHHEWDALVPALAAHFQVLTYDRRGHSLSDRPQTAGSVREDAADLAALLESHGLAPAHVVGNSFGGTIALRLACERPSLLRSLSVHEPPLFALLAGDARLQASLQQLQQCVAAVVERLSAGDAAAAAQQFVERIALGPGAWATLPAPTRRTFVRNAATWLDETRDPEWSVVDLRALATSSPPLLLTRGGRSPPLLGAVVVRLAHALPHAAQHVLVEDGHVPHLTSPQVYAEVLRAFAQGVDISRGYEPDPHPLPPH